MEIWHEIPGYDGWYDVSNQGRVRSWRMKGNPERRAPYPHDMATVEHSDDGRLIVPLAFDDRTRLARVARLVLITYIGPPAPGARACHRNGDPGDNRLENLYWRSTADIARAAGSKLSLAGARQMRKQYAAGDGSYRKIAQRFGVSTATARRAIIGQTWKEE